MIIQVPMQIDEADKFYTRVDAYLQSVDPGSEARIEADAHQEEREILPPILGDPAGRSVLDLTCGPGAQAKLRPGAR